MSRSILNPHQLEPAKEGLFCWRIKHQASWNNQLYQSENDALCAAQTYCDSNLSIGKHTIFIGVTINTPVDSKGVVDRYINTASQAWHYDELFRAMRLPKSMWAKTAKSLGSVIGQELANATQSCLSTKIEKVRHQYYAVTPAAAGILANTVETLLKELRAQYDAFSTDWLKVARLQQLLRQHADIMIDRLSLPFTIESMRIWQGIDRTKDRLHIVCDAPYEQGRFERIEGDTLCQKSPTIDGEADDVDLPCLACLDRLVKTDKTLSK